MNSVAPDPITKLSPRQMEIVSLLATGKTNREVASLLGIRPITVQVHIYNACHRLNVENRILLIIAFVTWKLQNENR